MLQILLGYIRCDGFFEDASTSFLAVDPILVCLPSLLVNGHLLTRLETRTKESNACASSMI